MRRAARHGMLVRCCLNVIVSEKEVRYKPRRSAFFTRSISIVLDGTWWIRRRSPFDAHGYSTGTGRSGTRSTYGVIRTICGDAGHYVIMLDRRRGFVLDKSRFLSGDPEAFASFLERCTGKRIQMAQ